MGLVRVGGFGSENPNWRGGGLRVCVGCGREFKARHRAISYCSRGCYSNHRVLTDDTRLKLSLAGKKGGAPKRGGRKGRRCKCQQCGIDFIHPSRRKYCEQHQAIARMAGLTKAREYKRPMEGSHVDCPTCGTQFYRAKKDTQKYCSYPCFIASGGAIRAGLEAKRKVQVYGAKKDANHKQIIELLQKVGTPYIDLSSLGCGVPDLLVEVRGLLQLWEIKNKKTSYGRRGLNKNQKAWAEKWRGSPIKIITSIDEALAAIGASEAQA